MSWTTPDDVKTQLRRHWDRGHLLTPRPGEPLFPLTLRFSRPDTRALSDGFDEVRKWIRLLDEGSKSRLGFGYEIRWSEINHRQLGANRVPSALVVPTVDDALALMNKRSAAERFRTLVALTERACPALLAWTQRRPLLALGHAEHWARVLAVVGWFQAHPRPGIYLRQLDIATVDTKFVETNRALFAELLDEALPPDAIDKDLSATRQFDQRYGLLVKEPMVRFRVLDDRLAVQGLTDLATPAAQFARLCLPVRRVFITENEINGVAFPPLAGSMVVFGLGYGLDRLARTAWLHDKAVHYWGDIDTHGFAMVDRLRAQVPHARSLLMDRETLLAHQALWGQEPTPHQGRLERLTEAELRLVEELRGGDLGPRVRLEQERIGFSWVERALSALEDP